MEEEQSDYLFAQDELELAVSEFLTGSGRRRLSIAYVGEAVEDGTMDAVALADGLRGVAKFVNRVAELHFGSDGQVHLVVQGEPQSGSLEVFVSFAHPLITFVEAMGSSKFLTGVGIICTLTGFSVKNVGKSLLWIFKKMKGRPITDSTDLSDVLPVGSQIARAELIRIYNDPEVQAAIRASARPLRKKGLKRFETRVDRAPVEVITKEDVFASDVAEMNSIVTDERKVLDIEKASFVPHLAWHLSDNGKPFDANIEDPLLWKEISDGNRFGFGDRLHVTLHTEAERDYRGRLKIVRTITKVHIIERTSGEQISLPF